MPADECKRGVIRVSNGAANVNLGVLDSDLMGPVPKVWIVAHCILVLGLGILDALDQMDDLTTESDQFLAIVRFAPRVPLQRLVSVNGEAGEVMQCRHKEPLSLALEQLIAATERCSLAEPECSVAQCRRKQRCLGVPDRSDTLGDRRHEPMTLVMAAEKPFRAGAQQQMPVARLGIQDAKGRRMRRHDKIEVLSAAIVTDVEPERLRESILPSNEKSRADCVELPREVNGVHMESRTEYTNRHNLPSRLAR